MSGTARGNDPSLELATPAPTDEAGKSDATRAEGSANQPSARSASRNSGNGSTGRPRSEEAHKAILDATIELLVEVGFSSLTVEGVAQRAGVGKATIYRRWPSKLPLVVEAFSTLPGFEAVDTGSLRGDLIGTLKSYLESFNASPLATVYPSLAGEQMHNPELSKLLEPVARGRREPFVQIFRRAQTRGEVAADADVGLAADLVVGPIAVAVFLRAGTLSPSGVEPIVDLALLGILKRDDPR